MKEIKVKENTEMKNKQERRIDQRYKCRLLLNKIKGHNYTYTMYKNPQMIPKVQSDEKKQKIISKNVSGRRNTMSSITPSSNKMKDDEEEMHKSQKLKKEKNINNHIKYTLKSCKKG